MKIFSWNVNGLRSIKTKTFDDFINLYSPDILCLQETRLHGGLVDEIDLPFKYKYFGCAEKKGYSGTAILSNIEPVFAEEHLLDGHPSEGRIVSADFGKFKLVDVYVPNSKSNQERLDYRENSWGPDFRTYLRSLGESVIVCGDFNVAHEEIDLINPESNEEVTGFTLAERNDFSKLLNEVPLVDIWRMRNPDKVEYSWWSYQGGARWKNWGWRIDYFLVSPKLVGAVEDCSILTKVKGSDHCPISLEMDV